MTEIEAFVLAGGKSKRFGQDKATLRFGDKTLLERIYDELKSLIPTTRIIGKKQKISHFPVQIFIEDLIANAGPIGGLYTALFQSTKPLLLTSCDMPFIRKDHIKFLIDQFDPQLAATIAISEKGMEPLFGIYQHQIISVVKTMIESNEYAMHRICDHIDVKFVDFSKAGYISDLFFNINTLSDYKKALYLKKTMKANNKGL